MKTTIQKATKEYPYLAVYSFDEVKYTTDIPLEDIVLISELKNGGKYVQYINGGQVGHTTEDEAEYQPLPQGFKLTIIQ